MHSSKEANDPLNKHSKKTIEVREPDTDEAGKAAMKAVGGSRIDEFNHIVSDQALASSWLQNSDKETRNQQDKTVLAAMIGIRPTDEIEGMLAAQMIATHNAAMECFRRGMLGQQTFEGRRENLNQANKLVRSFSTLLEALNRHRGKGQQQVRVEHVHVNQGGQAIVGAVQGGGVSRQTEDQPHAPGAITHEPGEALPSQIEEVGEAVPSTGG